VVEIAFGLFTLATSPYISPWIDLLNRAGSAHQLCLLALLCYFSVEEVSGLTIGVRVGSVMIFFSSIYVVFLIIYLLSLVLKPLLDSTVATVRRRKVLTRFGIPPASLSELYVSRLDSDPVVQILSPSLEAEVLSDEAVQLGTAAVLKCSSTMSNESTPSFRRRSSSAWNDLISPGASHRLSQSGASSGTGEGVSSVIRPAISGHHSSSVDDNSEAAPSLEEEGIETIPPSLQLSLAARSASLWAGFIPRRINESHRHELSSRAPSGLGLKSSTFVLADALMSESMAVDLPSPGFPTRTSDRQSLNDQQPGEGPAAPNPLWKPSDSNADPSP